MTEGEFEYTSMFRLSYDGSDEGDVAFSPVAFFLWCIFLVTMPILFANLLVLFLPSHTSFSNTCICRVQC